LINGLLTAAHYYLHIPYYPQTGEYALMAETVSRVD